MSNRRKLPSEKARRLRCPKCREKDPQGKDGEYGVWICQRCGHTWPKTP